MKEYIIHTTTQNERIDEIAQKYYGNCFQIQTIIEANPWLAITPEFEEGIELLIPVIEQTVNKTALPIWKRES